MVLFSERYIFTHNILNKLIKSQHLRLYLKTISHTIFDKLKEWCAILSNYRANFYDDYNILSQKINLIMDEIDFTDTSKKIN